MKLLFDQNLSLNLVSRLAELYPGSNHVDPLQLSRISDVEVWEFAKREGYVVVTKDADFSDLCLLRGFPPYIVWLRRGNCRTREVEDLLRRHVDAIKALGEDDRTGVLMLF